MNLTISQKIMVGFLTLMLIALAAGLGVLFSFNHLQDISHQINARRVPLVLASADFRDHLKETLSHLRGWMISHDPDMRQLRAASWQEVDGVLRRLRELSLGEDDGAGQDTKERLQRLAADLGRLRSLQDEVERLVTSADNRPAHRLHRERWLPLATELDRDTQRLILSESRSHLGGTATEPLVLSRMLVKTLSDLRGGLSLGAQSLENFLLTGETTYQEELERRARVVDGALAVLGRATLTPEQTPVAERLVANWQTGRALLADIVVRRQDPRWDLALWRMDHELVPLWNTLSRLSHELAEGQQSAIVADGQSLDAAIESGVHTLGWAFLVLMVLGLGWGLSVTYNLRQGLRQLLERMTHVSRRIREADLMGEWEGCSLEECLVPYRRRDEIGYTVQAYNELLVNLIQARENEYKLVATLTEMNRIAARFDCSVQEKIQAVLILGAGILGMGVGIVSRIEGGTYHILQQVAPEGFPPAGSELNLDDTFCAEAFRSRAPLSYHHVDPQGDQTHPALKRFGLRAYLGAPLYVGSELFGTVCFSDAIPRSRPFSHYELSLVNLLSQWVGWEMHQSRQIEEIHRARSNLETAQRIASMGSWHWDQVHGVLDWSPEVYRIFGLTPGDFRPTYEGFLLAVYPEDRDKVDGRVRQVLDDPSGEYQLEHRIMRPDGEVRIVLELGQVVRDEQGVVLSMIGTVQDVTEQRKAAEGLYMARMIFEHAGEAIVITDPDGHIEEINPAYERITGFTREELRGKNPRLLKSGHHDDAFYVAMWQRLATQGSWQGEIWDRRKNGEVFPKWLTINAIRNDRNDITHYVGIFMDISQQKATEEQLERLAFFDPLTGLPNRTLFRDRLRHEIELSHRNATHVCLFFIDLDRFKHVNDTLGHDVGDDLLVEVATRIQACVRKTDTVARLGGDEFTVILPQSGALEDVSRIAVKIIDSLKSVFQLRGQEIFIGASIGAALCPSDGADFETLTKHADTAMYKAKESGRGTYCFFTQEMNEANQRRLTLEKELRIAVEQEGLTLFYQPKVHARSGAVTGMEALVRWVHPVRGMVSPGEFIPLAEETGLIIPMGEWILRRALEDVHHLTRTTGVPLRVAVNLSAKQFQDPALLDKIRSIMAATGAGPESVEMEITESLAMGDVAHTIAQIGQLRQLGVPVSIDDFGTGYSSLSYLKKLPLTALKIDRSFIMDVTHDAEDDAIVSTIISMAHALGLSIVAEGVETWQQLDFLNRHDCPLIQGYLFSKPLPRAAFEAYVVAQTAQHMLQNRPSAVA
ncbi:MAG: EAL domain-containing protein [Magnetococcus sp. WYHC-3]